MIRYIDEGMGIKLLALLCLVAVIGCSAQSAQKAGEGATVGAAAGAVGGLVTALVFGGNAAEAAARGAVWGASSGAVAGGIAGAQTDQAKKQNKTAELEKLKTALGEDAYNGLEALAQCKHEVSLAYAKTAAKSDNPDYSLAGLWLEVLTFADQGSEENARALFGDLIAKDKKINSEAQAEEKMRNALQKLMEIRGEHGLPKVCG